MSPPCLLTWLELPRRRVPTGDSYLFTLALALRVSQECDTKHLVVSALISWTTSILLPSRSYSIVYKQLMPNPFRGASSSSKHTRSQPGFEDSDDQQKMCRGRWTVSRYFWTLRRNRQMHSLPSSRLWDVSVRSSNTTK